MERRLTRLSECSTWCCCITICNEQNANFQNCLTCCRWAKLEHLHWRFFSLCGILSKYHPFQTGAWLYNPPINNHRQRAAMMFKWNKLSDTVRLTGVVKVGCKLNSPNPFYFCLVSTPRDLVGLRRFNFVYSALFNVSHVFAKKWTMSVYMFWIQKFGHDHPIKWVYRFPESLSLVVLIG